MSSALALPPPSSNRILAATSEHWRLSAAAPRNRLPSLPTELLSVSPEFIAQLRNEIAPKRKGGRVRFMLTLMLVVVLGVLASDRSTREFAMENARVFTARYLERRLATAPVANVATPASATTPAAPAASPAVSPAATTDVVQRPVLVVPAKAPKMVSPAPPKKRAVGRPVSAVSKGVRGAVLVVGSSPKSSSRRS